MKKNHIIILCIFSLFLGCRHEPPADNEIKKRMLQYFQSVNLPFEIEKIQISSKKYDPNYYAIEVQLKAKVYTENKNNVLQVVNNTYDSKFNNLVYGYWLGRFSLRRFPPSDSIICKLSSLNLRVSSDRIKIVQVDTLNNKDKFYPVIISTKDDKSEKQYTLPFSQDEFGIWKIGVSKLITPEGTVKSFLSDVNQGLTSKARRYFDYEYKYGYDETDKKRLENLFPAGSIKDIQITDVNTGQDTSFLNLTVVKTNLDTFKTNLELVKLGFEWRFRYLGLDWKFMSNEFHQE